MSLTLPGIVPDVPDAEYHSGPGLSSTGAKRIIECPALYRFEQDNPVHKDVYDQGHVIHELVLGKGSGYVVVDGNRNAKDVKARVAEVRAEGKVPIKSDDLAAAQVMADAVHDHPEIGRLFATGAAEQSVYVTDPETGAQLRCRPDWLTETNDGRPVCIDVKSTAKGTHERDLLGRYGVIARFGYHQSADFYANVLSLAGVEDALFGLLFVSKSGPPMPRLVWLNGESLDEGRRLNREAIETYVRCTETGDWSCPHPAFITGSIFEREAL